VLAYSTWSAGAGAMPIRRITPGSRGAAQTWDEFDEALSQPVQPNADLARLLSSPSVFDA